jgi:alanine dehydrogenase
MNLNPQQLVEALGEGLRGPAKAKKEVSFLLGTDQNIHQERRTALVPEHLDRLRKTLAQAGIELRLHAVRGVGERARDADGTNYPDEDYRAVGAEIVEQDAVHRLSDLDLLHALKEPTEYEANLPGPFLRLGAVHLASKPPGLCRLLGAANFAAVIDGATVGNCSYRLHGGDRTPIVGSMSRFAGSLAGRKVVEGLDAAGIASGKVVVVGGGIAGLSAIRELRGRAEPLVVVDPWPPTRERLHHSLPEEGFPGAQVLADLTEDAMTDAVGIVFAHRAGAKKAEKVCSYERHIQRMRKGGAIADIAIDQGGSIDHAGFSEDDDVMVSREKYIKLLGEDYFYYAETNMPREEPYPASRMHGDSSLAYVTALLGLCAIEGSAAAAARELLFKPVKTYSSDEPLPDFTLFEAVCQDLRNGTQIATREGRVVVTDPDIAADPQLMAWVEGCS